MAVDIISAYRNVSRDLRGLLAYEPIARKTLEKQHDILFTGKADRTCHLRVDQQIPHYNNAVDEYNETVATIKQLRDVKMQMEKVIMSMSDAEQIIITLHVEQGMNLREIADKSNYSYGHLRNLMGRLRSKELRIS